MKKITMALTVLCLVFAPLSIVQAQSNSDTVVIYLNTAADTIHVSANEFIVLHHGWAACTRGLVKMYLSAAHTELGINGEIVSEADGKDQFWSPIKEVPGAEWLQYCVAGNGKTGWRVDWDYPLGTLTPGEYEIYYKYWFDHPVVEGTKFEQNSRMNVWGKQVIVEKNFTIVVE